MTSEDRPPAVTRPRKTLSEVLGSVVISRGDGGTNVFNLLTQTFQLLDNKLGELPKPHDLHIARNNDLIKSSQ